MSGRVAGKAALRGHVLIPRVGAWHGTLWLDADTAPTGAASLVWGDSEATWSATILRGGVMTEGGPAEVRFVGGGGGLATALAGGSYRNTSPRSLLGQILPGGGERLSGTSPTTTLDAAIARWSRDAGTCRYVQDRLREAAVTVRHWLADGAAVYVCGSLQGMAAGVEAALVENIEAHTISFSLKVARVSQLRLNLGGLRSGKTPRRHLWVGACRQKTQCRRHH